MTLSVSIVVPAYNAEKSLKECLDAIYSSIQETDEVIIVNDCSSDSTSRIAKNYNCKLINLSQNSGAANARNVGTQRATGDLVFFIDSDVVVSSKNIEDVRSFFLQRNEVHSVTTNVNTQKIHSSFFSDFKNLYMNYVISSGENNVNYIYGSFCGTRNVGFIKWPASIKKAEDSQWGYSQSSLGLKIQCLKDVEVKHLKEYTCQSLIFNDFSIASSFTYIFLAFNRWSTLYSKKRFGHTSKAQKVGIISSFLCLITFPIFPKLSLIFFMSWLFLNMKFFKFIIERRNTFFLVKSVVWYFASNIIFFLGIVHGSLDYLIRDKQMNAENIT